MLMTKWALVFTIIPPKLIKVRQVKDSTAAGCEKQAAERAILDNAKCLPPAPPPVGSGGGGGLACTISVMSTQLVLSARLLLQLR